MLTVERLREVLHYRAMCHFDHNPDWRVALFGGGLRASGIEVVRDIPSPSRGDVLVVWNRQGHSHTLARKFEAAKGRVIVVENGYMGVDWRGEKWYAMALNHHNGAGAWPQGGPERWDSWNVPLAPWREPGGECVVLAQRGIGEPDLRPPADWIQQAVSTTRGRIRRHPGTDKSARPLEIDLARASSVATWSSGAAIKALAMGIPVYYGMPGWVGATGSRPLANFRHGPCRDDEGRLAMFRRLAWAMWNETEIANGTAFKALLA